MALWIKSLIQLIVDEMGFSRRAAVWGFITKRQTFAYDRKYTPSQHIETVTAKDIVQPKVVGI
jgi:hypothetical protein